MARNSCDSLVGTRKTSSQKVYDMQEQRSPYGDFGDGQCKWCGDPVEGRRMYCDSRCCTVSSNYRTKGELAPRRKGEERPRQLARTAPSPCVQCGRPIKVKQRGCTPKYCSRSCRETWNKENSPNHGAAARAKREAKIQANLEAYPDPTCAWCGGPCERNDMGVPPKFCKKSCRDSSSRAKILAEGRQCEVSGCQNSVSAGQRCATHHAQQWREQNPEAYLEVRGAYNLRKLGATVDEIDRQTVFERDGWTCGICGGSIDPELRWPDRMSAQVDHVVPLAKGGDHSWENVQAAHFSCNAKKKDQAPVGYSTEKEEQEDGE